MGRSHNSKQKSTPQMTHFTSAFMGVQWVKNEEISTAWMASTRRESFYCMLVGEHIHYSNQRQQAREGDEGSFVILNFNKNNHHHHARVCLFLNLFLSLRVVTGGVGKWVKLCSFSEEEQQQEEGRH
jgi:hypothetical protein